MVNVILKRESFGIDEQALLLLMDLSLCGKVNKLPLMNIGWKENMTHISHKKTINEIGITDMNILDLQQIL